MQLGKDIAAVVTGGASGLGAATGKALAAKGVKVAILDLNAELGDKLAREISGTFAKCDVTSEASVDAALAAARKAHGQERILVNCAGTGNAIKTASRDKKTGETRRFPTDAFNFIIQINLVGTFRCIAISAQGMLSLDPLAGGERGAIVNTASVAGLVGERGIGAYSASTHGVVGLTRTAALDYIGRGIRINAVCPGATRTRILADWFQDPKVEQFILSRHPIGRIAEPEEIGRAVLFLASDDASFVVGQALAVDGGLTAQ